MAAIASQSFADRVALLHASSVERRELKQIAADHALDSQFELLGRLHAWALAAAGDMRQVYDDCLAVEVQPASVEDLERAVRLVVNEGYAVTFTLVENREAHTCRWRITASFHLLVSRANAPAKLQTRTGPWTRREFENTVLTLLTAYERARPTEAARSRHGVVHAVSAAFPLQGRRSTSGVSCRGSLRKRKLSAQG